MKVKTKIYKSYTQPIAPYSGRSKWVIKPKRSWFKRLYFKHKYKRFLKALREL